MYGTATHASAVALLVGTSGFDYRDWRGPFYPRFLKSGDRLAFYAEHFDTVELNVTFYRDAEAGSVPGLARGGARRFPVRGQGQPLPDAHQATRGPAGAGRVPDGARRRARRQ